MTEFTKGPWQVERVQGNHFTFQMHIGFPDGSGVPLGAFSDADANLIGAAPELYEALEEAVNWLKAPTRERKLIDPEKLAAVLRKARGEG